MFKLLLGFILWTIITFIIGFFCGANNYKKKAELVARARGFSLKEEIKRAKWAMKR